MSSAVITVLAKVSATPDPSASAVREARSPEAR